VIEGDRGNYYQKRSTKDIWQNMYEPLLIESKKHLDRNGILRSREWLRVFGNQEDVQLVPSESLEHKLTHQTIKARFWKVQTNFCSIIAESPLEEIAEEDLKELPIPRLIEKYLELSD
jgi:A/G-specific adenine glycosylase